MISFSRCVLRLGNVGRPNSVSFTMVLGYATNDASIATSDKIPAPRISSSNSSQFRRGAGGRSSFSGNVVTVFGASGFLGTAVVNRLARHGNQLIIPYRSDPYFVKELKVVGDLGQILFFPFNLKDEESIRKAVKYSNVVINTVGTNLNTKNFSINDTNVDGARMIAKVCREMGVNHLVHVSALNANLDYIPKFYKKATFLKSKALGEIAVREEFPSATIIRPACMYGEGDQFIYGLISHFRKNPFDGVYVYKGGEETYKMPIYVSDVAHGLVKTISDPNAIGKTYEFVGPHCYKFSELVDFMYAKARIVRQMGRKYHRKSFMDPWFWFWSNYHHLCGKIWCKKMGINKEYVELAEAASDILTGAPTLAELGISRLSEFEYVGAYYASHRDFMGDFEEEYGEINDPPLPLRSPPLFSFDARKRMDSAIKIQTEKKCFTDPFLSSTVKV